MGVRRVVLILLVFSVLLTGCQAVEDAVNGVAEGIAEFIVALGEIVVKGIWEAIVDLFTGDDRSASNTGGPTLLEPCGIRVALTIAAIEVYDVSEEITGGDEIYILYELAHQTPAGQIDPNWGGMDSNIWSPGVLFEGDYLGRYNGIEYWTEPRFITDIDTGSFSRALMDVQDFVVAGSLPRDFPLMGGQPRPILIDIRPPFQGTISAKLTLYEQDIGGQIGYLVDSLEYVESIGIVDFEWYEESLMWTSDRLANLLDSDDRLGTQEIFVNIPVSSLVNADATRSSVFNIERGYSFSNLFDPYSYGFLVELRNQNFYSCED